MTKAKVYTATQAIELGRMAACPECNSSAITNRKKLGKWRCQKCKHECDRPIYRERMKSGMIRGAWNKAEIAYLCKHYGTTRPIDIASKLNRSRQAVYKQATTQGLTIVRNTS